MRTTAVTPHLEFSCTSGEADKPVAAARNETPASTVTAAQTPNVLDYDILLVNISAGKDSQASLDVVVEHARQANVLDRVVVVHTGISCPTDLWWTV